LAAAGGEPLWALVDLVAPSGTDIARSKKSIGACRDWRPVFNLPWSAAHVAGPVLELHVFAVGRVPKGRALLRSGAHAGDSIYVTGSLGGSFEGKHLTFEPRTGKEPSCGRTLGFRGHRYQRRPATDLRHVLEQSHVGAEIETTDLPISSAAKKPRDKKSPLEQVLFDGEDFELLFTVRSNKTRAFEASWRKRRLAKLTRIGRITRRAGVFALVSPTGKKRPSPLRLIEHFRCSRSRL
jgi:thiamine-monophosphate kinase